MATKEARYTTHIPNELLARIDRLVSATRGATRAEMIREALALGAEVLERERSATTEMRTSSAAVSTGPKEDGPDVESPVKGPRPWLGKFKPGVAIGGGAGVGAASAGGANRGTLAEVARVAADRRRAEAADTLGDDEDAQLAELGIGTIAPAANPFAD